jgi:hypothetical protein
MMHKPITMKPILPHGIALNLTGPDFSKLNFERPLTDPDDVRRAKAEAPLKDSSDFVCDASGGAV